MRNLFSLAVVAALVTGVAFADAPAAPAKAAAGKTVKAKHAGGTVEAVDAAGSSLTVKTKKESLKVVVNATTKIKKGGKPATLADIAAGDSVQVTYTVDASGANVASVVTAKAPKAPAKH